MTYYLADVGHDEAETLVTPVAAEETHTSTGTAKETETGHEESGILGFNPTAFIIQLVTFVLVFLLLKKFAFNRIVRMLDERHKTIDDGIRLGQKMEKEQEKLQEEVAKVMRDARVEADRIIADGQKEAREVIRDAEKSGQRKVDAMITDAEARINEEADQAKLRLEKEIAGLVGEATEAVVGEKVDGKKDAELIDKALKGRK